MDTPDVRVRLSAEGVAEVVAALKKVQAEAAAAGSKGSKSFGVFNSALGGLKGMLRGLTAAFSVGAIIAFVKSSAEAADQLGKLSQKVGASVSNLSALSLAVRTADVSDEQLATGLIKLNKNLADLASGSPTAAKAFRQIGLSAKDFKGKDAVEAFELVSKGMAGLKDGAGKTETALTLFGRGGASLIPLLNDLASEGLGKLLERARQLGVLFDDEMVASVTRMNDDFALLTYQAKGLATQFAAGLAPSVSQALSIMSGGLEGGSKTWREFGEAVGVVLKGIVATVASTFDIVGTQIASLVILLVGSARALGKLVRGDLKGAAQEMKTAWSSVAEAEKDMGKRVGSRFELVGATAAPAPGRPRTGGGEGTDPAAAARARAEFARAALDNELALVKAQARAKSDEEKRAFDRGLLNVQEYYEARRKAIDEAAAAETAALLKRKALLSAEPDEGKRRIEAARIEADLQKVQIDRQAEQDTLTFETAQQIRELAQKQLGYEKQILEAQGRRHEAALADIKKEVAEYNVLLQQQGVGDEERLQRVKALRAALTSVADFEQARTEAEAGLAELGRARAEIETRVRNGQLTELQGEKALLDVERERLVGLRGLASALVAAAEATGDPEKIAEAKEFAAAVEEIAGATERSSYALTALRNALEQSGIEALTDFFAKGITEAENFGQAVRDMAMSVIQSLRQITAQMLASNIIRWLSALGGGGGNGGGPLGDLTSGGHYAASGGLVLGPGTGTSDSIPVRVSNHEFIMPARVVESPGMLAHLEELRLGLSGPRVRGLPIRSFAAGGLIESSSAPGRDGRLVVGLERGLVLREMESPEGQRLLVKLLDRNRRAVQDVTSR